MIILLFSQLFNQSLANFHYNFSGDFSIPVKKKLRVTRLVTFTQIFSRQLLLYLLNRSSGLQLKLLVCLRICLSMYVHVYVCGDIIS